MRSRRVSAVVLVLFLLGGRAQSGTLPATQAAASGTQPPTPVIRAQANLVLVDVVVRDKDAAVHGLTGDKFHVFDNGVAQEVTVFEEHRAPDPAAVAPGLGPNIYSNLPTPAAAGPSYVLLLDALNTPVLGLEYGREQMLDYLKTIPPGTRVAVFTLLPPKLRMVQGLTADAAQIATAVKNSAQQTAKVVMIEHGTRALVTLEAVHDLARTLSEIPGRKNLIWFTHGPLPSPASGAYGALTAARVAVYPVDVCGMYCTDGLQGDGFESLAPPPPSLRGSSAAKANVSSMEAKTGNNDEDAATKNAAFQAKLNAINVGNTEKAVAAARENMQQYGGLKEIAHETGGEASILNNDIAGAVAKAITDGADYYTIGYVPSVKEDGTFHELKLTLDGKFDTEYRRGYFAVNAAKVPLVPPSNPSVAKHPMSVVLQQGAPQLSDVVFKVRVDVVDAADRASPQIVTTAGNISVKPPAKRYALDYAIPADAVHFTATGDGLHHARVEYAVVAYNSDGRKLNYRSQNADYDLKPATYDQFVQHGIPMHQEIDLPHGAVDLRIVVHDLNTDRVGAIEVPVSVAK